METGTPLPAARQATLGGGGREDVSTIMARAIESGPQVAATAPARRILPDRPQNPASSRLAQAPNPQPAPRTAQPQAPQTTGTQFLGAQFSDTPGLVPPDSMGAVGPSQFIVIVNGRIRSFNKTTGAADGALNSSTNSFFNTVRNGVGTSDPRVRYDRLSGRWFLTIITVSTPNRVLIAYSSTGTITGAVNFTFFFYDVNPAHPGCLWDYDTLGIDQNALYIGGDLFCGAPPGTYAGAAGLVVGKTSLLGGGSVSVSDFALADNGASCGTGGDGPHTPQGVDNYDPASPVGYFAGASNCFYGELVFARISNPGGTPSGVLLKLTVPPTTFSMPAPALGSTHPLDALDDRLFAAHLRNGHVWTAHNICVDTSGVAVANSCPAGSRDGSRWYDVTNLDTTPTLNQSGTVFDGTLTNPRNYWIPSMMVSGQGHVAMGTSAAGATEHAEAATMGRLAGDAPGTMNTAVIYQTSPFTYNLEPTPTSGFQRWGDYSYTSLDPNDDMTMWTIQEFTNATDSWGVEAVQLKAPPPATPTSPGSTTIYTNQCSQVINVTGTSSSGSGFFDPGPGFPNHLHASVSGGVTVNKVTYVDPTHISLDISTQGAATGLKNLTVTNPDGQAVTVNNFLNVTGASSQLDAQSAVSTAQYSLQSSDGATWQEIDPGLRVACAPAANQSTLLTANTDLWTWQSGQNQDIGIFVSHNGGADALVAWKESGGSAGTFSPNAAFVQSLYAMTGGDTYVFKLKWKTASAATSKISAGAGPIGGQFSPTSLTSEIFPSGSIPNFAVSTQQYSLTNSDGTTWQPIDATNLTTDLVPGASGTAVLGANADLWTWNPNQNQDIGIFVADGTGPDTLVSWKESGGSAGTFSPNAAFVKGTFPVTGGHTYHFKLKWKTASAVTGKISAGAGPISGQYSPTSLFAYIPTPGTNLQSSVSTSQYNLANSDGATWTPIDAALNVNVTAAADTDSLLGANADLWTWASNQNQDIGIFAADGAGPDVLVAWKESGGSAGTFSPNAAFVQARYPMISGHTYHFKLKWKTASPSTGQISAGAGPISGAYSPTRLTVELVN